jgi:translation initiation factor IF-2
VCAAAEEYEREAKRTDVLVDAHKAPSASGIVLDVVKTAQEGTTGLVLIFRGKLKLGQNFVAGSGFGKITNILSIHNESLTEAIPGMVVKVGRLVKSEEYTGDFAPDDFFHVLPRERAWRIAFHRQRIEWLSSFQTGGSKLTSGVSFELPDAVEVKNVSKGEENREGIKHLLKDAERNHSILVEPVEEDDQDEPIRKRAERESEKVRTRWQRREEARIALKQKQIDSSELERQELHKMRQFLYTGEIISSDEKVSPPPKQSVPKPPAASLPQKAPVVPVIVKTASVSEFDLVLDELESLEQQFNVKIPVVHGGIGPVTPNDVVHAEIESKFSPCPIYMVNTSALPQSVSKEVQLVTVENVSHLVSNVRQRIKAVIAIESRNSYNTQLGMRRKLRA